MMDNELKRMTLSADFWKQGFRDNLDIDASGAMILKNRIKRGAFFSRTIDLLESQMTYHRLVVDGVYPQNSNIRISVRASDSSYIFYKDRPVEIDAFLGNPLIGLEEKQELFNGGESIHGQRALDILLHKLKGRYLWIYLSVFDMSEENIEFKSLRVEFPQKSFIEYLPEVYQQNGDFLKRYLSIFQSIYLDMERSIDRLPMLIDVDTASGRFLDYLASWLGVSNEGSILNTEQFRYIVKNAVALNKAKGTVWSIINMVRLYTGEDPYIVEFFELKKYGKNNRKREELYEKIYTDNPHTFCIILKNGTLFEKGGSLEELSRLVEKVRPANTVARIIVLKQSIRLDMHSYIGMNTRLERRNGAVINENSRIDGSFYLNA